MKYLCLIYADEARRPTMPKAESDRIFAAYLSFTDSIRKSGNYIGANRLQPASSAITVRVRNDKLSVTDGPYAETKEQLGGYYLVEAADLDAAVEVASRIPGARFGSIEVRPVAEMAAHSE